MPRLPNARKHEKPQYSYQSAIGMFALGVASLMRGLMRMITHEAVIIIGIGTGRYRTSRPHAQEVGNFCCIAVLYTFWTFWCNFGQMQKSLTNSNFLKMANIMRSEGK